jgi:AcrR family transcriptional regulator
MQIDPEVASDKSADGAATEPQPSLREAQKEFTRQRLLDAAEELFESVGYRSATIEEIANRAGANRATFYLHFQGKLDLAKGLAGRLVPHMVDLLRRLAAKGDLDREAWRAWLIDCRQHYRDNRTMLEVILEAQATDDGLAAEVLAFWNQAVSRLFTPALERGTAEERESLRTKLILLFLLAGRCFAFTEIHRVAFPGADPIDAMADMFASTLGQRSMGNSSSKKRSVRAHPAAKPAVRNRKPA